MTQIYTLEVVIIAIVLIALYIVSKTTNDKLKFFKKEIEDIDADVYYLYERLGKEPSFSDKKLTEEKRVNKISKNTDITMRSKVANNKVLKKSK